MASGSSFRPPATSATTLLPCVQFVSNIVLGQNISAIQIRMRMTACVSCLLETPFSNVTHAWPSREALKLTFASPGTKGHACFRECAATGNMPRRRPSHPTSVPQRRQKVLPPFRPRGMHKVASTRQLPAHLCPRQNT